MERQPGEDFSVVVLASDLGVDARSFLSPEERRARLVEEAAAQAEREEWHDCSEDDFSDMEALQLLRFEGSDKLGNPILRVVGKYFPATVISGERLKRYVFYKLAAELPEGPFCILYIHTTVQKEDNNPGILTLRWIYEELPVEYKERLQVVYFLHPGLQSRLVIATLGRMLLSGGIYWKVNYVSRLQYLWEEMRKDQVEIPEFVRLHDEVLERRPLTDYGIEPDPFHIAGAPAMDSSFGRYEDKWSSREYM